MKIIIRYFLLLSCFGSSGLYAQTENVQASITDQFNQYQQKALTEKIFVHTDKNTYLAGEILWFKVYSVDGTYAKPLDLSKVCYLELIDKDQQPIINVKVRMDKGSGTGSINLPVSVNTGNYTLRAYTNWMKNFSSDFYFQKSITLINTIRYSEQKVTSEIPETFSLNFFPEGGNIVEGLKSKIAFQTLNRQGKGIDCTGIILNQKNDTIVKFKPLKFGIGSFYFKPEANQTYVAKVKYSDGQLITWPLPQIYKAGTVMELTDENTAIKVKVQTAGLLASTLFLIVHSGQQVTLSERIVLNNNTAEIIIPRIKLPQGVTHFTLFNSAKQPLCERLYFVQPKTIATELATDKPEYATRGNVNLELNLKDNSLAGQKADLSVSIYRLDSLEYENQSDILNYLILTSELRGTIERPDYYLKALGPERDAAINNLMLTHGWRRFKWDEVFNKNQSSFNYLPEYNGHIISGKVINTRTGSAAPNILGYLSVPGKRIQFYTAQSDSEGNIRFHTNEFIGWNEVIVQTDTKTDSMYRIEISSPFSPIHTSASIPQFIADRSLARPLYFRNINVQAQNVYTVNRAKRFLDPGVDSTAFYGAPSKKYFLDNYTRFTTLEEVLREYVIEIGVDIQRKNYHLKVLDTYNKGFFGAEPLILLDGVPVFNTNKIIQYDPLKIMSIEVLTKRYIYGQSYFEGIINFETYKNDLAGFELDPKATVIDYDGVQLQREFYSPVYTTESQVSNTIPDFRDLLFWAPKVNVDSNGKGNLSFSTSDQSGNYVVVMQGITSSGKLISKTATFIVKDNFISKGN